jgi:hypothetical protein
MWGINGSHSFAAEEVGASSVTLVDLYATDEFHAEHERRASKVRLVLGEASATETVAHIGMSDIVWCLGVLYHHPNPHRLVEALGEMCRQTLVLESMTAPEIPGIPNAGVYLPMLPANRRAWWDTTRRGASVQLGISVPFDPTLGGGKQLLGIDAILHPSLARIGGLHCPLHDPVTEGCA